MTLYLLKVHLQTFLSIPITKNCQILSRDTLVANERYDIEVETVKIYSKPERETEIRRRISESRQETTESIRTL